MHELLRMMMVPLLEEYFYGDEDNYKKALKILGFEDELNKK